MDPAQAEKEAETENHYQRRVKRPFAFDCNHPAERSRHHKEAIS